MLKIKTIPVLTRIISKIDVKPIVESLKNADIFKESKGKKDALKQLSGEKAVELGFADDILTDEKLAVDVPAYAFSGRAVENALLNKITAKAKPAEKAEPVPEPVKEEPAPEEPEVKPGRTIDELMARLNLIKP